MSEFQWRDRDLSRPGKWLDVEAETESKMFESWWQGRVQDWKWRDLNDKTETKTEGRDRDQNPQSLNDETTIETEMF